MITRPSLLLSSAVLLLLMAACSPVPTPPPPPPVFDEAADVQAVHQLVQDIFDDVWSAPAGSDTSSIARYHTADFILLEHGEVWTGDTIRNWLLGKQETFDPTAPERRNSFDFYRTEHLGDRVWAAYQNYGDWIGKGGDTVASRGWLESVVAVRKPNGEWKLEMMHSTRNTPPRR